MLPFEKWAEKEGFIKSISFLEVGSSPAKVDSGLLCEPKIDASGALHGDMHNQLFKKGRHNIAFCTAIIVDYMESYAYLYTLCTIEISILLS